MSKGDARFHALLKEIGELHDRKQEDYGREGDPFHNLRASEDFGMPPELGVAMRMNDKMNRVKTFYVKGELKNDSVEDDYMDLAVYALAAIILRRERQQGTSTSTMGSAKAAAGLPLEGICPAKWVRKVSRDRFNEMYKAGTIYYDGKWDYYSHRLNPEIAYEIEDDSPDRHRRCPSCGGLVAAHTATEQEKCMEWAEKHLV